MTASGTVPATEFFPLADAARYFPRPGGKKVSLKTLYRWASTGMRKGRLRTIRLGQQVCTSEDWVRAFIADLNGQRADEAGELGPSSTEAQRRQTVGRKLDALGI